MIQDLHFTRQEYNKGDLNESSIDKCPIEQFRKWFSEASLLVKEPNAMTLSTVFNEQPSSRIVLLKEIDKKGFTFFTNYKSRKGKEISHNPKVSLSFFWEVLERQVRIEGRAEKVSDSDSEHYFQLRPKESQVSACISSQSEYIDSKYTLEKKYNDFLDIHKNTFIARPQHWGGYRVIPHTIEFWQGRPHRLHDRIVYIQTKNGWDIQRLYP
ncbi:MAG: pyridoxamine 5'-phosphate oxidase [Chitinophagaceae bacterium]|nr:pyridoxamine 5'-phosphate oxidase [Chitinophagaceae bacterium]